MKHKLCGDVCTDGSAASHPMCWHWLACFPQQMQISWSSCCLLSGDPDLCSKFPESSQAKTDAVYTHSQGLCPLLTSFTDNYICLSARGLLYLPPVDAADIMELATHFDASTCSLYPVPTASLEACLNVHGPSLLLGPLSDLTLFPPLSRWLNPDDLNHFWPISDQLILGKILDEVVVH